MSIFLLNYFLLMSFAGFIVLLILSCLAFANVEALKIKKDKHIGSGVVLIIVSLVIHI
jgi:hypothetical protein